jgi:hypothetical protein
MILIMVGLEVSVVETAAMVELWSLLLSFLKWMAGNWGVEM